MSPRLIRRLIWFLLACGLLVIGAHSASAQGAAAEPTYTISGTVRDWDGAPLEHFWVFATGADQAYQQKVQSPTGEYTLRVNAGVYEVRVENGYWPRPASQRVVAPPNASGVPLCR